MATHSSSVQLGPLSITGATAHAPLVQACLFWLQSVQVVPAVPQAFAIEPAKQTPFEQHPRQVDEHDAASTGASAVASAAASSPSLPPVPPV